MAGQKKPVKGAAIRKNKPIILFLIVLFSFAGIAQAEQTNTISYLVNEPKSLKGDLFSMVEISFSFSGRNVTMKGKTALKGTGINFGE